MKKKIVELFNSIDFENLNEKQKYYYNLFVKYSIPEIDNPKTKTEYLKDLLIELKIYEK